MRKITDNLIEEFKLGLLYEEKSSATINKYVHDVNKFRMWLGEKRVRRSEMFGYKAYLCENYAAASVNSMIASLNSFFKFAGWTDMRIKGVKIQKSTFISADRMLTRIEYERLLSAARCRKNERLYMLMQAICSTGIRVSEVRYITVEALQRGFADIDCKGKRRRVLLPRRLCGALLEYVVKRKIKSGPVFVTETGNPLDRSNIWSDMKKLCFEADIPRDKVFPHNLRHLFARTYYDMQKDVVHLADILGHASVNTTRIYTAETCEMQRGNIERMGLLHIK